jgi:LacI family transcriptional regulator
VEHPIDEGAQEVAFTELQNPFRKHCPICRFLFYIHHLIHVRPFSVFQLDFIFSAMAENKHTAYFGFFCIFAQMSSIKKVLMLLGNYDPFTHQGIARAARDLGWHLNVSMLNSFQIPSQWSGDGIICSLTDNKKLERFVLESKLPCVDLSAWRTDLNFPRVSADNERIGRMAAEHFCAFGHRAFGWFCHQPNPVANARLNSYTDELVRRGFPPPVCFSGRETQDSLKVEQWLSELEKPSALFVYNDSDAAWLMTNCLEAGYRVPEEFAILGVDNNPLICEHLPVPLSSINHDHERIGYEGALLLNQIMAGRPPENEFVYIEPAGVTLRASSDALATGDPLVRKAVSYLQEHLREPVSTPDVAAALGVSRRTLELRFKTALGCSPHSKLTELRLTRAAGLLADSRKPVEEISALCGFCHGPHLCRVFKQQYGVPPLAYRKSKRRPGTS